MIYEVITIHWILFIDQNLISTWGDGASLLNMESPRRFVSFSNVYGV